MKGRYITFQKCAIYFLLTILIQEPLKVHIEAEVKYITITAWGVHYNHTIVIGGKVQLNLTFFHR